MQFSRTMKKDLKGIWSIRWGNPYTDPPEGKARILIEITVPWNLNDDKSPPKKILKILKKNPGYALCWSYPAEERKHWSPEAVRRNRIRRIEKRAERKYPLFKGEVIEKDTAHYKDKGWL